MEPLRLSANLKNCRHDSSTEAGSRRYASYASLMYPSLNTPVIGSELMLLNLRRLAGLRDVLEGTTNYELKTTGRGLSAGRLWATNMTEVCILTNELSYDMPKNEGDLQRHDS